MSGVPPPPQQAFPTPSPFSFSAASTGRSLRPSISHLNILLRFLGLLFSFACALSLAAPRKKYNKTHQISSFTDCEELLYCFSVAISAFSYSTFQLFKGVWDMAQRGFLVSGLISDYITFILDQLVSYLLVSSSSVSVLAIREIKLNATLRMASVISVSMSFATFLVTAVAALLSGYKLCKRIMW